MLPFHEHNNREHILSRIDTRIKILCALALLIMVLSYRGLLFPCVTMVICVAACLWQKVPLRALLHRYSEPLFIASVVLALKLFFSGKEILFTLPIPGMSIVGHSDGLLEGLTIAARIIAAVSIVALTAFCTPFTEILAGLSWFRMPRGFIEILMFAYRALFVLFDDAAVIYSAQKNRLGYSSIRRGLASFGVLAGSLTLKAFDNSHNTTVAMVQRGYDGSLPLLRHKAFKLTEVAASALIVIGMGFLWKM
jgi:cobalt/nickel transport system permease protein